MLKQYTARWVRLAFVAGVATLSLAIAGGTLAASGCRTITGTVTMKPLPPTECNSEVGICSTGTLRGGLAGTLAFTATSLTPTVDTPSTGVFVLTGDTVMTVSGGTVRSKDAAVTRQHGTRDFAEVITILGGTGKWADASGFITATGVFDAAGVGTGRYRGEVCRP